MIRRAVNDYLRPYFILLPILFQLCNTNVVWNCAEEEEKMLISNRHKFIFIHIYKNAGTSISDSLLPYAATQGEIFVYKVLRKLHLTKVSPWEPYGGARHLQAQEIIEHMGEEKFRSYFSFTIVRNPWDWQVSLYSYMLKNERHVQHEKIRRLGTFDNYIQWRCASEVRFQKDFVYSPDGELLVNYVGRFESLSHDFAEICKHIGIAATLPMLNVSNTKPYQSFYSNETRCMVAETFAPDIELFGYSFD